MASKIDKQALRRALVHFAELAVRAEHESIGEEGEAVLDQVVNVLEKHRVSVGWDQAQRRVKLLVEDVLVPLYRYVQEHPELTEAEVEARLVERSREWGIEAAREDLDDLVLLVDEISAPRGPGPVKAAAEAVGHVIGRSGRSILNWMSKPESEPLPPTLIVRWPGQRADNILLYLAGALRDEAVEAGRQGLVGRLTEVIDFIVGDQKGAAPPPPPPDQNVSSGSGTLNDLPD